MKLDVRRLARMMDLSAVRTEVDLAEVRRLAQVARRYRWEVDGGALLVDTPGVREFQLWDSEEGMDAVFGDIAALASGCRFGDCTHTRESGCAVLAAREAGTLPEDRYQSWLKLRKEQAVLETKRREKPGSDKQAWSKAIHKSMKPLRKLDPKARFRD